jgi:hypothetical protein
VGGDIDIDIDVEGAGKVGRALRDGLRKGLEDAGNWMLDKGEDQAKDAVLSADRVWRKTLKQGFQTNENQFSRSYHWQGKIENDAPHAEINEYGLPPGTSPSVQDIIPWVDDKLTPNAKAQASADSANVGEWDPQLQSLAAEYSPGIVITSFAVKEGLEEDGYPGIGFMETTETYLKSYGPTLVKSKVEKHMRRELRAAGLT